MCRRLKHGLLSMTVLAYLSLSPAFAQSHNTPTPQHSAPTHTTSESAKPPVPLVQRIDNNPQLMARLQPLVTPTGLTLDQAAAGFKNLGQFIAALHVSQNLGIPFSKLQTEMTAGDHDSLGKAIQDLKPTANAKVEARKAEREADADLKATRKTTDRDKDDKATDHDKDDTNKDKK